MLIGVLCALGGVWYFQDTVDDEIRKKVQKTIADNYPGLEVRVSSVHRVEGEGILIKGVSIAERDASGPQAELAYFEEIMLGCRSQIQDLLSGELDVTHIVLRRPTLRATRRADGTWSIQKLTPLPQFGGAANSMTIEQGSLLIFDPLKDPSGTFKIRDLNLQFDMAATAASNSAAVNAAVTRTPTARFKGSLVGDHLGRAEVEGSIEMATGQWRMSGRLGDVSLTPELRKSLPGDVDQRLVAIDPLRGHLAVTFHADHHPDRPRPFQFDARALLSGGRIDDARLPFPLTDVTGSVRINQDGVIIDDLTARSGRTQFWIHGRQDGFDPGGTLSLEGKAQRLVLDGQLVNSLPAAWKEAWNQYLPSGEVNATFRLDHDGTTWRPELNVECISVAFMHYKFPFRLEQATGTIAFKDNRLTVRITALAGDRPVELASEITNPGRNGIGHLVVRSNEVSIDQRFLQALPENIRNVINSFEPSGTINGYVRVARDRPDQPWQPHYVIDLNNIAIRYQKFRYPIYNVQGRLEGFGRHWVYRDLVGDNDTGVVTAAGQSVPTETGSELTLKIVATDVPLDEELRGALTPSMQGLWQRIKPTGRINVATDLRYDSKTREIDLRVSTEMVGTGIMVEPDFFPYRMENLLGTITFHQGRADFSNLTATHGSTILTTSGYCQFPLDGSWNCNFTNITADRFKADRELLFALPSGVRQGLMTLNFSGPLNLTGAIRFARGNFPDAPIKSDWNLTLNTLQGRIDCGIELDQINGGVNIAGGFDGHQFFSRGWLDIDSALYKGYQFTQIQGPLWLNSERILFGAWAEPRRANQPPTRITARFYGGSVAADCRIALGDSTRFALNAQLADGDLARFSGETMPGSKTLRGNVAANLQLQGTSRGPHTMNGAGTLRVQDGDFYELPLVLSLLKILSIKLPDSKAFDTCDVEYRIDGTHVLFDKFNFKGDAISMLGKGEMDFDHNLRMVFHAIFGNDQFQLPIVRPVLGLASQQLLLLYVFGTLDNPRTSREALPGVRRAVQEIQGEPTNDPGIVRQTTDWLQSLIPGG